MMDSLPPINSIPEAIAMAIVVAFALWAILADHEKQPDRELYKPGELLIYPNQNLDGYLVYSPTENYETLFEGTIEECNEWIQANTDYSGHET